MKYPFKKASFYKTLGSIKSFPKDPLPHLAFVGRSNVGKSSLINHLLGRKSLARVSTTPGKTTSINLFLIDDSLILVDLPGYGYAKRSKSDREHWRKAIETYFTHFQDRVTICHLIDSRHDLTKDDITMQQWCEDIGKKPLSIYTKIDKIKRNKHTASCLKRLKENPDWELGYSIKEGVYREKLIKTLNQVLEDGTN